MELAYNRNHGRWFANDVLRAIRRYRMIKEGERVCVGLSGGKDSVTLLFALWYLRRYSGLDCSLSALHVRMPSDYDTAPLGDYCAALDVPYLETNLSLTEDPHADSVCAACARLKRGAAARTLASHGIKTIAYGHHATDVAETLLMNIARHKRLASFAPKVAVPQTPLTIIRPMVYLTEETVAAVHRRLGLPCLPVTCPHADVNIRVQYKEALYRLAGRVGEPRLARRVVDSLERAEPWPLTATCHVEEAGQGMNEACEADGPIGG
jgi:tRNA(Ile)-lysidine synthase TilS/MesJ